MCVDYRDLNKACPKDNYPTPFIDQIIDDCVGCEIFSFMDGFSGYNQIDILPQDQHRTAFICPWGTFVYRKLPFGLKNAGATFQRAMSYAFHDIKTIVQPYLDDLPAKSRHLTILKLMDRSSPSTVFSKPCYNGWLVHTSQIGTYNSF